MHERLKELRIERNFKLKEVAEKLNVTIRTIVYAILSKKSTILVKKILLFLFVLICINLSRYEDGTREPSVEMIIKFCKLYDVSADYLLGLTDSY